MTNPSGPWGLMGPEDKQGFRELLRCVTKICAPNKEWSMDDQDELFNMCKHTQMDWPELTTRLCEVARNKVRNKHERISSLRYFTPIIHKWRFGQGDAPDATPAAQKEWKPPPPPEDKDVVAGAEHIRKILDMLNKGGGE